MTHETTDHPVSGVVLHTRADVDLAIGHWLLAATESPTRSRMEWDQDGVTMLKTGTLFSAISMSARLVHAAASTSDTGAVDDYLERALIGGPVIHDVDRCRYYALVPASGDRPWEVSRGRDITPLGRGAYVGVPRPGLTATDAAPGIPYWSVHMPSMAELCLPSAVAALVEVGQYELARRAQAQAAEEQVLPLLKGRGR